MAQSESARTTTQTETRQEGTADERANDIMTTAADRANDLAGWAGSLSDQVPEMVERGRQVTADAARSLDSMPTGNLVMLTALASGTAVGAVLSGGNRLVAGASLLLALAAVASLFNRQGARETRARGRT